MIFNVRGINIARAKKLASGGYDLLSRELQLYLDPVTNEILNVWQNPYSGKEVPGLSNGVPNNDYSSPSIFTVVHVANNPVYQTFPTGVDYSSRLQPGGTYTFQLSIPLSYPNPLNPTFDPDSPMYPFQGPFQANFTGIESFTFTFPASELASKHTSLPSTQVYWTRTSPLLPFMATPSTNTTLLFIASGSKVAGGWRNLDKVLTDVIEKTLPAFKEAPTERTIPGGGVSSWSYFARPDVFVAYKNGAVFPLEDTNE